MKETGDQPAEDQADLWGRLLRKAGVRTVLPLTVLSAVLYGSGRWIHRLHVGALGGIEISLDQIDMITSGTLFMLLLFLPIVALAGLIGADLELFAKSENDTPWHGRGLSPHHAGKLARILILSLPGVFLTSFLAVLSTMFFNLPLKENQEGGFLLILPVFRHLYLSSGLIGIVILLCISFVGLACLFRIPASQDNKQQATWMQEFQRNCLPHTVLAGKIMVGLFLFALTLWGQYLYAGAIYPMARYEFGGGEPRIYDLMLRAPGTQQKCLLAHASQDQWRRFAVFHQEGDRLWISSRQDRYDAQDICIVPFSDVHLKLPWPPIKR